MNSSQSILYFMHKFPKLQSLKISIGCDFGGQIPANEFGFSSSTMVKFFQYTLRVPSFSVNNIRLNDANAVLSNFIRQSNFSGVVEISYKSTDYNSYDLWNGENPRLKFDNYTDRCFPGATQQRITVEYPFGYNYDGEYSLQPDYHFIRKRQVLCSN